MSVWILLVGIAAAQQDGHGSCEDAGTWFRDVTESAGVRGFGNSLGVNLNDFDGDGDNDLYVATGPSRTEGVGFYSGESLLYLNQLNETGEMGFQESGRHWGVDDLCEDRAPLYGDLDNDGLPDLYVTVNGRNVLYRNEDGQGYTDVTAQAGGAGHPGWGHEGALLDYDRDGFLDIYFTNGPEDGSGYNTLLRNQADGSFQDVTDAAGVGGDPSGKGSCVLDANLDGWPDLFVTTGREFGNHLYINQGDGTFQDEAAQSGAWWIPCSALVWAQAARTWTTMAIQTSFSSPMTASFRATNSSRTTEQGSLWMWLRKRAWPSGSMDTVRP